MNTVKILPFALICALLLGCENKPVYVCSPLAITNASFELGQLGLAEVPEGWTVWGTDGSSPDTFLSGSADNPWSVRAESQDGDRYIGLVARASGTREAIAQELFMPIDADVEGLSFDMWVSLTDSFVHNNIPVEILKDYAVPVLLNVMVEDSDGEEHLVYTSQPISGAEWQLLSATVPYEGDVSAVILQADYNGGDKYNGHVLIDNVAFGVCTAE